MQVQELADLLRGWNEAVGPLYETLADALEGLVVRGELPAGVRLPAERQLATALNVSRGTVVRAYDLLRDRNRVHTRHGSGTVVGGRGVPALGPREARVASVLPRDGIFRGLFDLEDGAIDLRGAYWIGVDDLPASTLAFDPSGHDELLAGHGYHPAGLPALREQLAHHLSAHLDLPTTADQLLITTGGQQAISLATQLVIGTGDVVLAEELTYPGAVDVFHAAEARIIPVSMSPTGVDPAALRRQIERHAPRLVYLVPSVHNPTGRILPHAGRRLVADALGGADTVLIDDLTLAESWMDAPPPAPLATYLDDGPTVLTVGSLSKSLWGGLRIGWIRATGPVLGRLLRLKVVDDLGTPSISQAIAAGVLVHGEEIAARRRAEMRRRYDALTDAVARKLPAWSWEEPHGGLCVWTHLGGASSLDFAPIAARHGVGVTPGTASSVTARHRGWLRLPFGHPPEVLVEAVDRLAAAWKEYEDLASPRLDNVGVVV